VAFAEGLPWPAGTVGNEKRESSPDAQRAACECVCKPALVTTIDTFLENNPAS
jgi:hypothetical protein